MRRRQSLGSLAPRGQRKKTAKKAAATTPKGFVPVAKGVGDIAYAKKKQLERQVSARGGKMLKPPKTTSPQTRTRNGMTQRLGPDGIWRNVGRKKKKQ